MPFDKKKAARYVKGVAEAYLYDINTFDTVYYTNKIQTGALNTSANEGAIEGAILNQLLMNVPDTIRVTGTFEAADFSLDARGLAMGSTVQYNAAVPVSEWITATGTTLTVSKTPAPAYGQASDSEYYYCQVGSDGVNYGVDPATKEIQGFTAVNGQRYCVKYFAKNASGEVLTIPAGWAPPVLGLTIRYPVYGAGTTGRNGSIVGNLYEFIPRVQVIGGDAGLDTSQTDAATTPLQFTALSYDEEDVTACSECSGIGSIYGWMVYVPCDGVVSAVKALQVPADGITVEASASAQIPVMYVMEDNSLVTPDYSDLTYVSQATQTATVDDVGMVEGVAQGSTTVTVTSKYNDKLTTSCPVEVTTA